MGASQRRKGATYEREVAKEVTEALGVTFKRRLGQAREGGHDLDNPLRLVPECKRRKRQMEAVRWLEQAAAACSADSDVPIVFTRGDGGENVAVLYLRDFLTIYRKALHWDLLGEEEATK